MTALKVLLLVVLLILFGWLCYAHGVETGADRGTCGDRWARVRE